MNGKRWLAIAACGLSLSLGVATAQEDARAAARERRAGAAAQREREPRDGRELGGERAANMRGGPFAGLESILDDPEQAGELGLTPEQTTVLRNSFSDFSQRRNALREAMEAAGTEQARQMTAETMDEDGVMKAVEEAGRLRTEIAKLHAEQLILARKTLSTEQMERVRQRRRQRMVERLHAQRGEQGGEEGARIRPRGPDGANPEARRQAMRDNLRDRRQRQRPAPNKADGGKDPDDLDKTW